MKLRFWVLFIVIMAVVITACTPTNVATQPIESATETLPSTDESSATLVPTKIVSPTQHSREISDEISLDYSLLAQRVIIETVAAQVVNAGDPYWVGAPQYQLLTLQGYTVSKHKIVPQIYVYPAGELASANKSMGQVADDLRSLLQTRQAGGQLPMLPLLASEKQIINAQVQYLDFQNGTGVRYLTQVGNGIVPINNFGLFYTYQGLTSDNQYYIAVQLPITQPELPAGPEMTEQMVTDINNDPGYYMKYLSSIEIMLNQQPANGFVPDLSKLDSMIQSLRVPPFTIATPTPEIFIPAPLEGVLADKTREDLSSRISVDFALINVVEITHQDWPDICLGLQPAGNQECMKTNMPGWRIVLNAAGHTHEYRASEDGSLVSYSGPVTVASPAACQIIGTSQIYSPEDGYCFAYPIRFHRTEERGPIAIYGPMYGTGSDALFASLTVDISFLPDGQNLDGAVNDFLTQYIDMPLPQTQLVINVAGEPALMIEVVPGMPGSRDVFFSHHQILFRLTFSPAPSVATETAEDVEDLYRTVLYSWSFTN
jgi:hypothetical protein